MALLYLPPQVFDANGNPLAGAKYKFYQAAAHATPQSVFTDSALTIPVASLTADLGGYFQAAYGVLNTAYYVTLETAGGVIVWARDQIAALGSDASGSLIQTFADARWKVSSGLVDGVNQGVNDESGLPSPTNTGGSRRLGGWAGTQGTALHLDFAAINTTGKLKENSKKLPGVVYTAATTFTAVANVDISLPNDPVGCVAWDVDVWDLAMSATTGQLLARLSFDAGATYLSGASDYDWSSIDGKESDAAVSLTNTAATTSIRLANLMDGVTNKPGRVSFRVMTPRSGNNVTTVEGRSSGILSTGPVRNLSVFTGEGPASAGPCDHIRLFGGSGTITGKYRVMPLRGFGEV